MERIIRPRRAGLTCLLIAVLAFALGVERSAVAALQVWNRNLLARDGED